MDGVEEEKLLHFLTRTSYLVKRISFLGVAGLCVLLPPILHSSELENKSQCSLQKNILGRDTLHPSRNTILVFVSFSLPEQSLKQCAIDAKKAGASLVLRGLMDNSMKKTVQRLQGLMQETNVNVLIDPTLYRRFKIDKVPAVVVLPNHEIRFTNDEIRAHDVIYGQTTLDYALQQIAGKGEAASTAQEALKRLRGSS